ncbi:ankyrin repeat-containing domain protein [Trichoderma camerunense]
MDSPYTLNRGPDAGEEQRLHKQHYNMWMPVAKHLLPPHIFGNLVKLDHPPAIADLATGTGIWLRDLATKLPSNARLDGYDYDPSKFIKASQLPDNVRLFPGDILKPFPERLRAQYDVIHVRMLILGLKADQWAEAARNIKMLLRPGGWLEFALWSNAEVQYARSVGRDIIAPMRLLSQIQESGYVNCHESIYHSFGLPENLRKTTGRLFMAAARQILKGTLDKTESTIIKSHDEVDAIVDKVISSSAQTTGSKTNNLSGQGLPIAFKYCLHKQHSNQRSAVLDVNDYQNILYIMDQSFEIITPGDSVAADNGDIVMLSRDDTPETLTKIKQWLCPTDYAAVNGEFYKHLRSHVAGTGDWLYSTDAYKQWHDSEAEGILWLKGIPGSGKSEGVPVLYFFFRQIIRANYEPTALLRDWLVQILPYSPPLQARLKEYLDERRTIETLSITEMFRDLRLACTYVPKVYCFLHEMMITSRPVPAVETPLRPYPTVQIRLQEQLVDQDIAVYVQRLLASSRISKNDQDRIQQAILEKAGGIFLYAKLHILETLPANLNRSGIPHHVQLLVLQWVTHANRPLRLLEMSEMLSLKEAKDIIRAIFSVGQTRSLAQDRPADDLALACLSYLDAGKMRNQGSKQHPFAEYAAGLLARENRLLVWLSLEWPNCDFYDMSPLHLLERPEVNANVVNEREETPEAIRLLLQHGAESNKYNATGLTPLHEAAMRNHAAATQILLTAGAKRGHYAERRSTGRTPLQYACKNGHEEVVAIYLPFLNDITESGIEVDAFVSDHTALYYACSAVNPQTIEVLLKAGANPNVLLEPKFYQRLSIVHGAKGLDPNGSERMLTALHVLVDRIQKCFELVQEVGVDLEVPDLEGKTALHSLFSGSAFVSSESVFAMLRLLVKAGADVNTTCDKGDTPLHGNLTSKDARRTSDGRTPLLCLLSSQSPETSLEFLSFGPDCNAVDNDGNGALHVAVGCRHTNRDLILALLARGADPNMKNHSGQTALHIEGEHGQRQEDLIKLLVESGAELEARDNNGRTPLFQRVNTYFHPEDRQSTIYLKTFVELGAKTDCRDDKGRTLLHEAARCDAYDRFKYFLDLGVSPLAQDEAGNTMWHEAIYTRSYSAQRSSWHMRNGPPIPDIYSLLTESGVDPDQANNQGRTPLHIACSIEAEASDSQYEKNPINYLLSVCKNPSPADSDGITPLHLAATISEYHIAALLRAGANAAAVTLEGMTPLHLAARTFEKDGSSNVSTLVNHRDNSGRTALHYACRSGRPEAVAFLLASGADVNIRAKDGMTPLQECCGSAGDRQHRLQAAGLKLGDKTRPFLHWTSQQPQDKSRMPSEHLSSRLDEILDMLVAHGLDIQEAVSLIKSPTMGYTIRCFLALSLSSLREQAKAMVGPPEPEHQCNHIHCHDSEPDKFLISREYSRVEEVHREGADFTEASRANGTPWHSLLCTGEVWLNGISKGRGPFGPRSISSLLIAACSSRMPNMEVVKVLVESFKADVNAQTSTQIFNLVDGQIVEGETALHILARGHHCHGANVNLKDQIKRTPLHIALESIPGNTPRVPSFQEEAARILVSAGADIHASDNMGKSCLTLAVRSSNPRMLQVVLPPGTALDISILFVAIEEFNVQLFERLISVGMDVNKRCNANAAGDKLGPIIRVGVMIELDELYALLLVDHKTATYVNDPNRGPVFGSGFGNSFANSAQPDDKKSKYIRMMELLISHGVDLYARFNKAVQDTGASLAPMASTNETINSNENGKSGKKPPKGHHYEDCTVIHELLENSKFIQDIIDWKSLDLEHRDGKGRTLLMAACRNKTVADVTAMRLVELGADLSARDSEGKNALHHIFESHEPNGICKHNEVVKLMLSKRPELIHEEDSKGNLPINYVQPGLCGPHSGFYQQAPCKGIVDILLDAGSDPLHPDADGNFPIHFLGHRPKHALFQRFLDMGVPIDIHNTKNGNTPLFNWFSSEPSAFDAPQSSHFGVFNAPFSSTPLTRPVPRPVYPFPTRVLPGTATPSMSFPNTNFQNAFLPQQLLVRTGFPVAPPQQPVDKTKLEDFEQEQLAIYEKAGADFMVRNNAGETLLHTLASSSFQHGYGAKSKDDIITARLKFLVSKGLDPLAEDERQRTAIDVAVACDNKGFLDFFKK